MVLVAEAIGVPAMGLVDTDVLRECDETTVKGQAHNKSALGLIEKWQRLALIPPGMRLQDPESLRRMKAGRLRVLQPTKDEDIDWGMDMESLFRTKMETIAFVDGRGAPSAYGLLASTWIPEQYSPYLQSAFTDLEALASSQS
jgi:hypothetical protein